MCVCVCVSVLLNPCGRIVNVWSSVSDASLCSGANCGFELVALAERAQWETHPLSNDHHVWGALCRSSRPVSWISSGSILWLSHQQVGEPKSNTHMRADIPLSLSALLSEAGLFMYLCVIWRHNYIVLFLYEYIHTNISVFITVSSSPSHKTSRQSWIFHAKIIFVLLTHSNRSSHSGSQCSLPCYIMANQLTSNSDCLGHGIPTSRLTCVILLITHIMLKPPQMQDARVIVTSIWQILLVFSYISIKTCTTLGTFFFLSRKLNKISKK